MQIDDLTPAQARELAKPAAWTVQDLIDKLPHVAPWWMRDAVANSCEDRPELERRLVAMMDAQPDQILRLYFGLVLFFLGHARGREPFLAGLQSSDAALRKLALDQFRVLQPGDLGLGSVVGKLPAGCEEVLTSVAPLLGEPATYEGRVALDYALSEPVFALALGHTRPLLAHGNPLVRDKVVHAYLRHGRDDGAIDALAHGRFGPGVTLAAQDDASLAARQDANFALRDCAKFALDDTTRNRAGELALRVLQQTLRACAASGRSGDWREDGLDEDILLQTVVLARPAGAENVLLREVIGAPNETLRLRSLALLHYFDLSGSVPPGAQAIIEALVASTDAASLDERLAQFVARGMAGLPVLLAAARNPAWCFMATRSIAAWPRGADDGKAVDGLIIALIDLARRAPVVDDGLIESVASVLHQLPRTPAQDQAITLHLHMALEIAQRDADRPWIVQKILHQLVMFGDLSADSDSNIDPWDAMWAHWQRSGIGWDDAARMLDQICGSGSVAPARTNEGGELEQQGESGQDDIASRLVNLLGDRCVPASLVDEGYEFPRHEVLLAQMAAIVSPSPGLEAFSQCGEWQENAAECRVRFLYKDKVYSFVANPIGDWLDVSALVDGFNRFLGEIGHPKRFFRLVDPTEWGGEWGVLLCADEARFMEVNMRLRLPLQTGASA